MTTTFREKKKRGLSSLINQFEKKPDNVEGKEREPNFNTIPDSHTSLLIKLLNRMIANGISFDVGADNFRVMDTNDLVNSNESYLEQNKTDVLCVLQQSLLIKLLFDHSPDLFMDFAFEIFEREAIMQESNEKSSQIHYEAVKDVTVNWFKGLLDTKFTQT